VSGVVYDLSGPSLCIAGLPEGIRARLDSLWAGYIGSERGALAIEVAVTAGPEREDDRPFTGKGTRSSIVGQVATFTMLEGSAVVGPSGPVVVRLEPTSELKQTFALINLLMASLAWRLPHLGGALLHAAGVVLDGRAFLLVGAEGAGKSTWSQLAHEAGATVLSDDVVLVQEGRTGFDALASPFRPPEFGPVPPGRWPIAALLGSAHAHAPSLSEDPPLVAHARLAANVPYAVDGLDRHDALARMLDRLADEVPNRTLAFAKDASFVELLRRTKF
jgi:hypothetical protein